jgi:putative phage-type endonuclease
MIGREFKDLIMLTEENRKNRTNGIGASECAVVLGLSQYCTPYKLWMIKTNRIEPDPDNDFMWWGRELEGVIAKRYEYETGETLDHITDTFFHPDYKFILCHLDRIVRGKNKITEIKTGWFSSEKWGESGTDQVPMEYVCQVQYQMGITGYTEADLIVYFTNLGRCHIYHIKRDDELIKAIFEKVIHFWNNHVLADIAPDLTALSDYKLRYPKNNGSLIEATPEIIKHIESLKVVKSEIERFNDKKEWYESQLFQFIGENDGIKMDDKILASWKANKNGIRILRVGKYEQ